MNFCWSREQKWYRRNTTFLLTSKNTEIAISVRGRKLRELLAETNGIAGRAVRRVKEGTSAVLLQSGLDEKWWADSTECYCYLRNIQDLFSAGKTPYEKRFGMPFNGPVLPLGEMVRYHLISAKDISRLHQFGTRVLPRKFHCHILSVGGIWKRDIMVTTLKNWK